MIAAVALSSCGFAQGAPRPAPAEGSVTANPVTALGRIKPKHGLLRIAGPSDPVVVIERLFVEEGDTVKEGQRIALLDTFAGREAALAQAQAQLKAREADEERLRAELANARTDLARLEKLFADGLLPPSEREAALLRAQVAASSSTRANADLVSAKADLKRAQVELDRAQVRSPVPARVVKVHSRPGERVGANGIAELARTDGMYAVAEVYETDVGRVRVGQRAVMRIAALGGEWKGTVERIGMKIGKMDVLGTDPATRTDARVVEVEVRFDDGGAVAGYTNMQVEVLIGPQ